MSFAARSHGISKSARTQRFHFFAFEEFFYSSPRKKVPNTIIAVSKDATIWSIGKQFADKQFSTQYFLGKFCPEVFMRELERHLTPMIPFVKLWKINKSTRNAPIFCDQIEKGRSCSSGTRAVNTCRHFSDTLYVFSRLGTIGIN